MNKQINMMACSNYRDIFIIEKDYLTVIVWMLTSLDKVYLLEYRQTLIGILYVISFSTLLVSWKPTENMTVVKIESFPIKDMHNPGDFSHYTKLLYSGNFCSVLSVVFFQFTHCLLWKRMVKCHCIWIADQHQLTVKCNSRLQTRFCRKSSEY